MSSRRLRIGLLGGTFDPIHVGHVALGRAATVALSLDELRIVPTRRSWQKDDAGASAGQRAEMVRLAIAGERGWRLDLRETQREGPSYTVDTLRELRAELGPDCALVMILGSDQLRNLPTWHRWEDLPSLCHIAATQRERVALSNLPEPVERLLVERGAEALPDAPAGSVVFFRMPPVPVSSTRLRAQLEAGQRPAELLPPGVLDYIESRGLYRGAARRPSKA